MRVNDYLVLASRGIPESIRNFFQKVRLILKMALVERGDLLPKINNASKPPFCEILIILDTIIILPHFGIYKLLYSVQLYVDLYRM